MKTSDEDHPQKIHSPYFAASVAESEEFHAFSNRLLFRSYVAILVFVYACSLSIYYFVNDNEKIRLFYKFAEIDVHRSSVHSNSLSSTSYMIARIIYIPSSLLIFLCMSLKYWQLVLAKRVADRIDVRALFGTILSNIFLSFLVWSIMFLDIGDPDFHVFAIAIFYWPLFPAIATGSVVLWAANLFTVPAVIYKYIYHRSETRHV